MSFKLSSLTDIADAGFDAIIDVRAPSEFAEDHIPGAINLPVLSDAERAEVGTIYVQEDRFKARKIGAAHVSRNAAHHLETALKDMPGSWRPLVYCWRGGQRSGSFASILGQIGWRVELLEGGYRSYRKEVVRRLYEQPLPLKAVLIDGMTGTAKTRILNALDRLGHATVDLEGLAAHRGSLFGAMGQPQPSQKAFESALVGALAACDPARPILLEAESNKIGDILIPPSLWAVMRAAPRIEITAPLEERARFLVRDYSAVIADDARLVGLLDTLAAFHGHDQVAAWKAMAAEGDFTSLARGLMGAHYDPRYKRSSGSEAREYLLHFNVSDLSDAGLETASKALSRQLSDLI